MDSSLDFLEQAAVDQRTPEGFCSLATVLLDLRVHPSAIATAIEAKGVDGVDRFGRQGHFVQGSAEVNEALDALAEQFRYLVEPEDDTTVSPAESDDDVLSPFMRYGWSKSKLPSFAVPDLQFASEIRPTRREGKGANADMRIIAALVALVEGRVAGAPPSGSYRNRTHIVDTILTAFPDVAGLGESNLYQKIRDAEAVLNELLPEQPRPEK